MAIAWIDSEAASTTTDLSPYLPMLKKVALMYRTYLPSGREQDSFANFIDRLDQESWERLVENIPEEIAEADPSTFDKFNKYSAQDLLALI